MNLSRQLKRITPDLPHKIAIDLGTENIRIGRVNSSKDSPVAVPAYIMEDEDEIVTGFDAKNKLAEQEEHPKRPDIAADLHASKPMQNGVPESIDDLSMLVKDTIRKNKIAWPMHLQAITTIDHVNQKNGNYQGDLHRQNRYAGVKSLGKDLELGKLYGASKPIANMLGLEDRLFQDTDLQKGQALIVSADDPLPPSFRIEHVEYDNLNQLEDVKDTFYIEIKDLPGHLYFNYEELITKQVRSLYKMHVDNQVAAGILSAINNKEDTFIAEGRDVLGNKMEKRIEPDRILEAVRNSRRYRRMAEELSKDIAQRKDEKNIGDLSEIVIYDDLMPAGRRTKKVFEHLIDNSPEDSSDHYIIVDYGAGTFDISLIDRNPFTKEYTVLKHLSQISPKKADRGADGITGAIRDFIKGRYKIDVGTLGAEQIKHDITDKYGEERRIKLKGKAVRSSNAGELRSQDVPIEEIMRGIGSYRGRSQYSAPFRDQVNIMKAFMESITDIEGIEYVDKIYFVGGGAQFAPLMDRLKKGFHSKTGKRTGTISKGLDFVAVPDKDITYRGLKKIMEDKVMLDVYAQEIKL